MLILQILGLVVDIIVALLCFLAFPFLLGNPLTLICDVALNGWNEINSVFNSPDVLVRGIKYAFLAFGSLFCWALGVPFLWFDRKHRTPHHEIKVFPVGENEEPSFERERWVFVNGVSEEHFQFLSIALIIGLGGYGRTIGQIQCRIFEQTVWKTNYRCSQSNLWDIFGCI